MRHASTSYRHDPAGEAGGRRSAGTSRPRRWLAAAVAVLGLILLAPNDGSHATEVRFFRIGTGSTGGTYFPVGGLIASAISNPPGSRECERGGSCGVPGLIAAAVSTHGSVANIDSIASGEFESGLSQADVAYWAYTGTGTFKKRGPITGIRTIANLFPESLHLVVRRDIFLSGVKELRGKRFSVDREGSGTKVDALLVLKAYGLGPKSMDLLSIGSSQAADMMREGKLDGFFFVAGTPATVVTELADESRINLLPLAGPRAEALIKTVPFFAPITIPAGTYFNVGRTQTLSVGAQWVVSAEVPEQLVYEITRALWHENARRLLDKGHPKGQLIRLDTALHGLGAPLHPGAERYYREIGLVGEEAPAPTDSESQ